MILPTRCPLYYMFSHMALQSCILLTYLWAALISLLTIVSLKETKFTIEYYACLKIYKFNLLSTVFAHRDHLANTVNILEPCQQK